MHTIEIEFGPPWPSYDTFAEAVAAAESQPEQAKAELDSQSISGSNVLSGQFGASSCVLTFSNGWHLFVEARGFHTWWHVHEAEGPLVEPVPPRRLRSPQGREWEFDPNAMLSEIYGAELVMLRVTTRELLVYTRGHDIFWLSAFRDRAGHDLLHAVFEK